jgi:hypothetical protein
MYFKENYFLQLNLNKHEFASVVLVTGYVIVPWRLFFAAQQRIAITLSPEYYQKMQRSTTRRNQEENGPEVK